MSRSSISLPVDLIGDAKLTKDSKPPLPKVHSTPKKPSTPKSMEVKKPTEKLIKNAKSSPRITPKATPLQSPGAEHAPLIRETIVEIIKQNDGKDACEDVKSEDKNEEKKDQGSEKIQVNFLLCRNLSKQINNIIRALKRVSFKRKDRRYFFSEIY